MVEPPLVNLVALDETSDKYMYAEWSQEGHKPLIEDTKGDGMAGTDLATAHIGFEKLEVLKDAD